MVWPPLFGLNCRFDYHILLVNSTYYCVIISFSCHFFRFLAVVWFSKPMHICSRSLNVNYCRTSAVDLALPLDDWEEEQESFTWQNQVWRSSLCPGAQPSPAYPRGKYKDNAQRSGTADTCSYWRIYLWFLFCHTLISSSISRIWAPLWSLILPVLHLPQSGYDWPDRWLITKPKSVICSSMRACWRKSSNKLNTFSFEAGKRHIFGLKTVWLSSHSPKRSVRLVEDTNTSTNIFIILSIGVPFKTSCLKNVIVLIHTVELMCYIESNPCNKAHIYPHERAAVSKCVLHAELP